MGQVAVRLKEGVHLDGLPSGMVGHQPGDKDSGFALMEEDDARRLASQGFLDLVPADRAVAAIGRQLEGAPSDSSVPEDAPEVPRASRVDGAKVPEKVRKAFAPKEKAEPAKEDAPPPASAKPKDKP